MSTEVASSSRIVAALTGRVRRLAHKELELDRLRAELNSRLEALKQVYEQRITALEAAAGRIREGIEQFCRAERETLVADGAKSLQTPYGKVGFRRTGPQVVLADGLNDGQACDALRERDMNGFIRVRVSLDRTAVKRALEDGEADEALLGACGICLKEGEETFYCLIDRARGNGGMGR